MRKYGRFFGFLVHHCTSGLVHQGDEIFGVLLPFNQPEENLMLSTSISLKINFETKMGTLFTFEESALQLD